MRGNPVAHVVDIQPVIIADTAIALDDGDDLAAIFIGQKLGGVIAHIAKALNDHALAIQLAVQPGSGNIILVAEKLLQGILHAAPRRLDPPGNTAGIQGLARDTGPPVDIGRVHAHVLVRDPGHFTLARPHVGCGHVLRRVDQIALGQFIGKSAGDLLHLMFFPFARVQT